MLRNIVYGVLSVFMIFLFTGCGAKSINVSPEITYGNPKYKHIKDLPKFRYTDEAGADTEMEGAEKMSSNEYERLGDAFLKRNNYFMAYLQYEKALEKDPDNITVMYKKGLAMLKEGKSSDSIKQFRAVLDKKEDFAPAYQGIGRAYFMEKKFKAAYVYFQKATEMDPLLWKSYNYLGIIHDRNRQYEKAVKEYKTALTLKPGTGHIYNNLGVSLHAKGDGREAVKAFQRALEAGYVNKRIFNNLGWAFLDLEQYEDAYSAFKKGGNEAVALNNMGVGYLAKGNTDKAATYFKKAIEVSPRFYVKAHENLEKCESRN